MTACVDFHTQLASIVDVLAKAAVADICKLVEDGYALLQLEISRSQKENQMLKQRLQVMEMMVVGRGGEQDGPGAPEDDRYPVAPRPLESPTVSGSWTDPQRVNKPGDEEGNMETQAIKEERLEVDLGHGDFEDPLKMSEDRVVKLVGDDAGRTAVDPRTGSSENTTESSGCQNSTLWEGGGANSLFKAEPGNETVNHSPLCLGWENSDGKLNNLGYDYILFEKPSQTETLHTKEMVEVSTDADSEGHPAQSEHPTCLAVAKHVGSNLGFLNAKPGGLMMNSMPLEVEVEIRSAWKKDTLLEGVHPQQRHYGHSGNKGELLLGSVCESQTKTTAESQAIDVLDIVEYGTATERIFSPKILKASHKASMKEKRYICTYCGKNFSCPNHLKTHRRIHTGEKPFSCNQCGKRFSDSSNVKRHQNTHTGNKPFICALCGRGFSQSGCLITHQRVHTGEKPFSCPQCGKRFSDSSNLKRHQNTHIGKKPYICFN